jgi:leucine dehydrogenase
MSLTVERAVGEQVLQPDYEDVRVRRGRRSGLTMTIAVHRTVAGRSLGGCRMQRYASPDDAVRDAERLARAMTLKAAVSKLSLGGAKGVIALAPGVALDEQSRRQALRDFAELVESFDGRYTTAQDAGTSADDIAYVGAFTRHVGGRSIADGGCGDPSSYTAHGVEVAVRASLGGSVVGRHVVVVGLGHVGGELARGLARAGAKLTVSDVDPGKQALAERLSASWVSPEDAYRVRADVLAPCALGGVLDAETVAALQVPIVCGAANNQLVDDSVADALRERGIVWAPDFVINAGGLIAVADEARRFDRVRVERAIERIGDTLKEIYTRASAAGTNTLVAAMELATERSGGNDGDDI